jgi:hypothetical protein
MAKSSGKVGSLFYGMTLDTKEFKKRLKSVRKNTKTIGREISGTFKAIAKAGSFIGAGMGVASSAMLLFTKASLDAVKAQTLLAESIGSTQGEIAGLELFTKTLGVDTQMVLDKMREFGGLDEFKKLAEEVKNAGDAQAQLNKAIEIFGNEGTKFLPILQQGAAGFAAMEQRARDLGLALSPEQLKTSAVVWDQLADTWDHMKGLATQIAQSLKKPLGVLAAGAKAFMVVFKKDIVGGFEWVADKIESFIRGSFDVFINYGIPFINSFINFANQVGTAFNTLFTWLSPATNAALGAFDAFWTKMTDFVATFKDSLVFGFADGINSVIRGFFEAARKVVNMVNGARLTAMALLESDEDVLFHARHAMLQQELAITAMGKKLAAPFVSARDEAFDNMVDIIGKNIDKNSKQAAQWKGILAEFDSNFTTAAKKSSEKFKSTLADTIKLATVNVSDKLVGMIQSGSQEEQNILNRKQDKNLILQQKQLKAQEATAKGIERMVIF